MIKARTSRIGAALAGAAIALICFAPAPALAHQVADAHLPASFIEGLLAGLVHPITGYAHLTFIIAVGLASAASSGGYRLPLGFLVGTFVGAVYHLAGFALDGADVMVALSVLLIALYLVAQRQAGPASLAALFAIAGVCHGYVYAVSIAGAEPAPLYAYIAGFLVIQYAIGLAAFGLAKALAARSAALYSPMMRIFAVLIGAVGVSALLPAI